MTAAQRCWLLLCAQTGDGETPLSPAELQRLHRALTQTGPAADPQRAVTEETLRELGFDAKTSARILRLLSRERTLQAYLDTAGKYGIRALTRLEEPYPAALRRLGDDAPALLFCRGELSLLGRPAVSLVGSRRLSAQGSAFAAHVGRLAAQEGFVLVSGNAYGADQTAQNACLAAGGSVICVLADSLAAHRPAQNVLCICEDGWQLDFSSHRALRRNRIIHALGRLSFVAQTDYHKGGTWGGSVHALKIGLKVCVRDDGSPGADALIQLGARPLRAERLTSLAEQIEAAELKL